MSCVFFWAFLLCISKKPDFNWKHVIFFGVLLPFIAVSRVYLHYHTIEQSVAGLLFGAVFAIGAYLLLFWMMKPSRDRLAMIELPDEMNSP